MVFTLHRYIFREVIKVFILATVALTLMMSLGSILRRSRNSASVRGRSSAL